LNLRGLYLLPTRTKTPLPSGDYSMHVLGQATDEETEFPGTSLAHNDRKPIRP
jgi:hypothetical protein